MNRKIKIVVAVVVLLFLVLGFWFWQKNIKVKKIENQNIALVKSENISVSLELSETEKQAYDQKMLELANLPEVVSNASSTIPSPPPALPRNIWPVKTVYPKPGALLPFSRIVAYYGNLYSKNMGILGEYSEEAVLEKLLVEVKKWETADPKTKVVPALHYIAVVAQAGGGRDGKFRARMPEKEIEKVLQMAEKINAVVFLDLQIGLSNAESEIPYFEKYLKLPNVHLGLDPEFAMKDGKLPGKEIGTMDAKEINFAIEYLSKLVKENNLPPKVLVVHRFTQKMVTNAQNILPTAEVQVVMDMDGFGAKGNKINTYKQYIYKEPVQFTGLKLFYKNDVKNSALLEPEELLKLSPIPSYVQFQ
jgi:hypothetical protein